MTKTLKERDIERHLVARVKELGGEVRKVAWQGHRGAPDRLVMLPARPLAPGLDCAWCNPKGRVVWVEVKRPETVGTFPANAHERQQAREHERMRRMGQTVAVVGTIEQIEGLLP